MKVQKSDGFEIFLSLTIKIEILSFLVMFFYYKNLLKIVLSTWNIADISIVSIMKVGKTFENLSTLYQFFVSHKLLFSLLKVETK